MANNTSMTTDTNNRRAGLSRRDGADAEKIQQRRTAAPPVDIYENADELLVIADMPGVAQDAISISLDKMELTIDGRRTPENGAGSYLAAEGESLDYRRSFLLPQGIDADKIAAELRHGVLRVRLPKSAALKPRQIEVKAS